jgi:UTP--glucose-1-phosphate uridylyltransferase
MITKAIILAAGYGTRFLPATKAMPKEMLPVVDKPVIQYVVEDAVAAGVKDIVIVTSAQKRPIEDHFDNSFELEWTLENGGKTELLDQVRAIADMANFIYVRQKGKKGNMAAIACGYEALGDEPFIAMWGDDFFIGSPTRAQQMVAAYDKFHAPILSCLETDDLDHATRFGFAAGDEVQPGLIRVHEIVEKPGPDNLPSNYATVGGFVCTPELMTYADKIEPMKNGEYNYTDAISMMIADGKPVYALKIRDAQYFDCGNKLDYLKTNITLGLQHPELAAGLRAYLQNLEL